MSWTESEVNITPRYPGTVVLKPVFATGWVSTAMGVPMGIPRPTTMGIPRPTPIGNFRDLGGHVLGSPKVHLLIRILLLYR